MAFYEYRQNNSGGSFTGPALHVYIEADTLEEANNIFLTLDGCYFDPEYKRDCECCGTRWSEPWDDGYSNIYEVYRHIDRDATSSWDSIRELTNSNKIPEYLIREKDGNTKVI